MYIYIINRTLSALLIPKSFSLWWMGHVAGGMAQQLREPAIVPESLSSVLSTHVWRLRTTSGSTWAVSEPSNLCKSLYSHARSSTNTFICITKKQKIIALNMNVTKEKKHKIFSRKNFLLDNNKEIMIVCYRKLMLWWNFNKNRNA